MVKEDIILYSANAALAKTQVSTIKRDSQTEQPKLENNRD
jgi:hypothetical protein